MPPPGQCANWEIKKFVEGCGGTELPLLAPGQLGTSTELGGFQQLRDGAFTIVHKVPRQGGPSLCLKQSLFQVEDPSIIYELGIASAARREGILPPGCTAS